MEKVKVTRNYQVTIPASIRASLGLSIGDTLIMRLEDNKIIIEKKTGDISKVRIKLGRRVDWKYVEDTVAEAVDECSHRY